ncbi:MAG: ATP-binding protein, partial [Myxococcales bacterium]|nr:ATP-binding protein [Myxococcales bacterium]
WQSFRVSGAAVAKQFRLENPQLFARQAAESVARRKQVLEQWLKKPPKHLESLAELALLFDLKPADVEILLLAAAPAIDPQIEDLYAYVRNNVHKRQADVGFICQVLAMNDQPQFEHNLSRFSFDQPLRKHRLVLLEARQNTEDQLDMNLPTRRVRAADRVLDFIRFHKQEAVPPVDEALAQVCIRVRDGDDLASLGLPEYTSTSIMQLARARTLPVVLLGPEGAGKRVAAGALGGPIKRGVLSADLTALLNESPQTLEIRLAEIFREARLGGDLVYLASHDLPQEISGPVQFILERTVREEEVVIGADRLPVWASELTAGWPVVTIPLPEETARFESWKEVFKDDRTPPDDKALLQVARRYQLSTAQLRQAANEARRLAQLGRRRRIGLADLDKACRMYFAHQLSDLADLVPPTTFGVEDLVLPEPEKEKLKEVLLFSHERDVIFSDWGFGEKFPYGRGLSMLFYGPPGTGKSMSAMIVAGSLGIDLFRVDLSRILSRYVGETEKNLAKIFDEAERGRVMLLFDEADSLFTKRTDVSTSVDRYANLEVAYLLQRMENFEGITVLTTNVEHMLDDAFKRRIRYRIYFPMPDDALRAELWRKLLPKQAPLDPNIEWDLLGETFELSGGYIKQAVLRAAVYARRDRESINLLHLVEAALAECRELGMLVSDRLPKKLQKAVDRQREARLTKPIESASEAGG